MMKLGAVVPVCIFLFSVSGYVWCSDYGAIESIMHLRLIDDSQLQHRDEKV